MKKKEEMFEDEGEWFTDEGMEPVEAMTAMTGFLKVQHQGALELTKLTLEYCKIENLTKEKVFNIFQDAVNLVQKNLKNPMQ